MAFVPDKAIDELTTLSKGARHYYVFLARCRNQKSGKCCPSVQTTMEALACNRGTVYALRKELQAAGWATFSGDSVANLYGFDSLKNQIISEENKTDRLEIVAVESEKSDSPKNQTARVEPIGDSASLQIQTVEPESEKSDSASLKIQTNQSENSDNLSENSDSHIRKNQQIEPANRTSKESPASASLPQGERSDKTKPVKQPPAYDTADHKTLMAFLREHEATISDGAAQGAAVKWLLIHGYTVEQCRSCFTALQSQGWRKSRVSWLTVKTEIGAWTTEQQKQLASPPVLSDFARKKFGLKPRKSIFVNGRYQRTA